MSAASRVSIKQNGTSHGQVVILPTTFDELLALATDITQTTITHLYNLSGDIISTIEVVRDGDIVIAGGDEPFIPIPGRSIGQAISRASSSLNRPLSTDVRGELSQVFQPYQQVRQPSVTCGASTAVTAPVHRGSRSTSTGRKRKHAPVYSKTVIVKDGSKGGLNVTKRNTLLTGQIMYQTTDSADDMKNKVRDVMLAAGHDKTFRYMKYMNRTVTIPFCAEDYQWDGRAVHTLAGQGGIYVETVENDTAVEDNVDDLDDFVDPPRLTPQPSRRRAPTCTITAPVSVRPPTTVPGPLTSSTITVPVSVRPATTVTQESYSYTSADQARDVSPTCRQTPSTITAPVSVRTTTTLPVPLTSSTMTAPISVRPATTVSVPLTTPHTPSVSTVRQEAYTPADQARFASFYEFLGNEEAEDAEYDDDEDDVAGLELPNSSSAVTPAASTPSLQNIIEAKINELQRTPDGPTLRINTLRRCIYRDALRRINTVHPNQLRLKIRVNFLREAAVDEGGPCREFFRMYFKEATAQLLTTDGMLRIDGMRRADGEFRTFGIYAVLSLLNGCAGPRCFAPPEASLIVYEKAIIDTDEMMNEEMRDKMKQMMAITDVATLRIFVDEQLEGRFNVGYAKPTPNINLTDRRNILEQYLLAESNSRSAERTEFVDGLRTCDFLRTIRKNPQRFFEEFVRGEQQLTAPVIENLIHPAYTTSDDADPRVTQAEEEVALNWINFLQKVEGGDVTAVHSGHDVVLTLGNILSFITGASAIPPIPFFPSPTLKFDHTTPHRAITANTCSNQISIPINNKTKDPNAFCDEMILAIYCSAGFGMV